MAIELDDHAEEVQPAELEWLRALATGDTVGEIAAHAGWPERSMHRHLASLYRRLGVRNRNKAVAWYLRSGHR